MQTPKLSVLSALLSLAFVLSPTMAQDPTCRDHIAITPFIDGAAVNFSFNGTGTHHYGDVTSGQKAGEYANGVYTCWHPAGWKAVEVGYEGGVCCKVFDSNGKVMFEGTSDGLAPRWHPTGHPAFAADGGRVSFWHPDGSPAVDARMCQAIWRDWGTPVEVDEWDVWSELLFVRNLNVLVPTLARGLEHDDPWVRAQACAALGGFGDFAAPLVPALRAALADPEFWLVRQRAAEALAKIGPMAGEAVLPLAEIVRRRGEELALRCEAARALGQIGAAAASAVPALEEARERGPTLLQVHALDALGRIAPQGRKTAAKMVEFLADPETASAAVEALYYRRGAAGGARAGLERFLAGSHEESMLAMQLAEILYAIDSEARLPEWFLAEGIRVPVRSHRIAPEAVLAFCMVDTNPAEIVDLMHELTSCDNDWIKSNMLDYASSIGPEARAAIPGLVHLLSVTWTSVNEWGELALARIGPDAIPALSATLHGKHDPWSSAPYRALNALAGIGIPATTAIAGALSHVDDHLAEATADRLGGFGPGAKAALPALRKALGHRNPTVRTAAALAIAKIEGPKKNAPKAAR